MRKAVLLGFGLAAVSSVSSYAGTMGPTQAYPAGFVIGGDVGYGYLSTQETDLTDDLGPFGISQGNVLNQHHQLGDFVWGVHLGYDFSILERFLMGLELGYKGLGKSSYTSFEQDVAVAAVSDLAVFNQSVKLTQQAIDLLLSSRFYVFHGLNFFGKAGAAYVRSKTNQQFSVQFSPVNPAFSEANGSFFYSPVLWRIEPEFALGVGYTFKNNIDLHVMYTYINGTDGNNEGDNKFYVNQDTDANPGVFAYNALTVGINYYFG